MTKHYYKVSCAHLVWVFDLCRHRNIRLDKLSRDSGYPLEHLLDEHRFIPWQEFAQLTAGAAEFLDEFDLREAGKNSWKFGALQSHARIGSVMFSPKDQYLAIYGALGFCPRHFPVQSRVEQPAANKLVITITMQNDASASHPFYTILAGQMEGLTLALGLAGAAVTMKLDGRDALYTIRYPQQGGFMLRLRQFRNWFYAARIITRDLATLREAYERLTVAHENALADKNTAQAQLEDNAQNYQLIGASVTDAIWALTREFAIAYSSPSVKPVLGYAEAEFQALSLGEIIADNRQITLLKRLVTRLLDDGALSATSKLEADLLHKDKGPVRVELSLILSRRLGDEPVVVCVARDLSDRRRVEVELKEQAASYQTITDSAPDAIVTFDERHLITYANPVAGDVFGHRSADLTGMNVKDLMPESLGDGRLREIYNFSGPHSAAGIALKGLRKDRRLVALQASYTTHEQGGRQYKTGIIRDVSGQSLAEKERRALESQLHAAQKMDAIGKFSGGIVHDFNNLLVAVLGYADLAMQSQSAAERNNHLEEIKKAGARGTDMTQDLLTFGRRRPIEPKLIAATELLAGVRDMITRLLPRNIEVEFIDGPGGVFILADSTQLEQVLMNLAVNARDAMPAGGKFRIAVSASAGRPQQPGQLIVAISDTGMGMDEEVQKRIFEPLYTTKPAGSGTGLGLSVVSGIIDQLNGSIAVDSAVGQGTTFTIRLPVAATSPGPGGARPAPAAGGTETILVVEDNDQVREIAKLILLSAGYRVIEAAHGREGVEKLQDNRVDLVLMDVIMPHMGGREAADIMLAHKPDTRIVFTTGYAKNSIYVKFIEDNNLPLLPKPYDKELLRTAVRSALDGNVHQPRREQPEQV